MIIGKDLVEFVNILYEKLGGKNSKFAPNFENIIDGPSSIPVTEWYGDVYWTLKTLLKEKAIKDQDMLKKSEEITSYLSEWFLPY